MMLATAGEYCKLSNLSEAPNSIMALFSGNGVAHSFLGTGGLRPNSGCAFRSWLSLASFLLKVFSHPWPTQWNSRATLTEIPCLVLMWRDMLPLLLSPWNSRPQWGHEHGSERVCGGDTGTGRLGAGGDGCVCCTGREKVRWLAVECLIRVLGEKQFQSLINSINLLWARLARRTRWLLNLT